MTPMAKGPLASFCRVTSLLAYSGGLIVGDVSALRSVSVAGVVKTFAGTLPNGSGVAEVMSGSFSNASYGGPLGLAFVPNVLYSSTTLSRSDILASDLLDAQVTDGKRRRSGRKAGVF